MPRAFEKDLQFISKSHKERLDYLSAGASLFKRTGLDVNVLRIRAATDRLALAKALLKEAKMLGSGSGSHRTVVGRAYYAMYHAMRAATFLSFGGDDHESHTVLPSKLPIDFPDRSRWQNLLKGARLERNRADYDPYPRRDKEFKESAMKALNDAVELIAAAGKYIREKS